MGLVTPGIGLIFWTTLAFLVVFFLLKKMAWKPILENIQKREENIEQALKAAEHAKMEMAALKANNEKMMKEAREERDTILKEARDQKDVIISEAKAKAQSEADRILAAARDAIKNEKMAAIAELKNQVATLSIDIAEKILKTELSSENKQAAVVNNLVNEINLN